VTQRRIRSLALLCLVVALAGCLAAERGESGQSPAPSAAAETRVVEIPKWKTPAPNVLTGGQPTPEQLEEAADLGYTTIVNLRSDGEPGFEWEPEKTEALGMEYVHLPVAGAKGLSRENVERLAEIMAGHDGSPIMIHCRSGNRVGALFALKAAWLDGTSVDEALRIGREYGLGSAEEPVANLLRGN
jgi:uncharacterized protein (TIGR01244 family)